MSQVVVEVWDMYCFWTITLHTYIGSTGLEIFSYCLPFSPSHSRKDTQLKLHFSSASLLLSFSDHFWWTKLTVLAKGQDLHVSNDITGLCCKGQCVFNVQYIHSCHVNLIHLQSVLHSLFPSPEMAVVPEKILTWRVVVIAILWGLWNCSLGFAKENRF